MEPGVLGRAELQRLTLDGVFQSDDNNILIGQNTIKLHIGDTAWLPAGFIGDRRILIDDDHPLNLRPGDIITVITKERIRLPLHLSGCMYPRGRLLPVGILIPTTHIDPGFAGYLRVILANVGTNIIKLPFSYEVARAEFSTLSSSVDTPYHGVNAELKALNPQSDDLIIEVLPNFHGGPTLPDLLNRLTHIEAFMRSAARRRRRSRLVGVVSTSALLAGATVALAVLLGRKFISEYSRDVVGQVLTAGIVGLLALVAAITRSRITIFIRKLLEVEEDLKLPEADQAKNRS